jgi:rhodanese-related sulfurtransferase
MTKKIVLIIFIFTVVSCKETAKRQPHASVISAGMAQNLITQQMGNANFSVIDVRTKNEFLSGHISDAQSMDWYTEKHKLLELNPKNTYLLVCQSGRRSQLAMAFLKSHGFSYVFSMDGGMTAWESRRNF